MSKISMSNVRFYMDMYNATVDDIFRMSGVYFPRIKVVSSCGARNIEVASSNELIRAGLTTRECYEAIYSMYQVVNIVRRGIHDDMLIDAMLVSEELGY